MQMGSSVWSLKRFLSNSLRDILVFTFAVPADSAAAETIFSLVRLFFAIVTSSLSSLTAESHIVPGPCRQLGRSCHNDSIRAARFPAWFRSFNQG